MDFAFPVPDRSYAPLIPFWDAAAQGRLVFPRCTSCGAFNWYPQPNCAACGGAESDWVEVAPEGRLFSWTIVRRALHPPFKPLAPYAPVLIEFDQAPGVRLVTRWIGDQEALAIGRKAAIIFGDLGTPALETGVRAPLATAAN